MRWKLGGQYADFTGLLNGTITVVEGVVTTEDRLEPAVSETLREHFEAERIDDPARGEGDRVYPQGKITGYKLDGAFAGYTGMLNGTYQVVNGMVYVDPRLEPEASRILREQYGAEHVEGPTGDEVIAAEQRMHADRLQKQAEEDRERMASRRRQALDDVRSRQGQVMAETGAMTAPGFENVNDVTAHDPNPAGHRTVRPGPDGGVVQAPGATAAADPTV